MGLPFSVALRETKQVRPTLNRRERRRDEPCVIDRRVVEQLPSESVKSFRVGFVDLLVYGVARMRGGRNSSMERERERQRREARNEKTNSSE